MDCVQNRIDLLDLEGQPPDKISDVLLQTIRCPKNFSYLQSKLPRSNYESALDTKYVSQTLLEKNSTLDTLPYNFKETNNVKLFEP